MTRVNISAAQEERDAGKPLGPGHFPLFSDRIRGRIDPQQRGEKRNDEREHGVSNTQRKST